MRFVRNAILAIFMLSAVAAEAARLTPDDAASAARGFAAEGRHFGALIGATPRVTREHVTADGANFFSVRMSGGGTVFLAGDDTQEPVIAFTSEDVDFDALDDNSPLKALLKRDAEARRASAAAQSGAAASRRWQRLLAAGDNVWYPSLLSTLSYAALSTEPGDVRVSALVETLWNQESDKSGNNCYNYYTPSNYVCGCIATAMSQVMRYHRWPDAEHAVSASTKKCFVAGVDTNLTMQGGIYNWDSMPTDRTGDRISTDTERQAIGKLTSDAGISVNMEYTLDGSGAYDALIAGALMDNWRYGQSTYAELTTSSGGYVDGDYGEETRLKTLAKAFFSNFDAGCPVLVGINNDEGDSGHEIVADGYGFDGEVDYVHLNLGWGGQSDLWYNLPNIGTGCEFSTIVDVVYNVFPTNGTSYAAFSGRVTDLYTNGVAGASVTIKRSGTDEVVAELVTSDTGVYGAVLPGGASYDVVATASDLSATGSLTAASLSLPSASSFDYYFSDVGNVKICRYVSSPSPGLGNSWGNDVTLGIDLRGRVDPTNFYVSASLGVDAPGRGTLDSPFATIQYAIDNGENLVAGDIIYVLPGTYHGCIETPETSISIVSTDGPEVTLLDGDGEDCCYYGCANQANLIDGFTITNGAYYGGIYFGTATNCVIVNCDGYQNADTGGGATRAFLYGCVLHNNEAYYGGGATRSTLVNCTVYDNWAKYDGGGVDCNCAVTNSIVWRNTVGNNYAVSNWEEYRPNTNTVYRPSFAYSCTYPAGFTDFGGNITNDPQCVSMDVDDWRLRSGSPCLGTGLWGLNMGAWQGAGVEGHVISASVSGRGSVEPWSIFVTDGGSATFTASGDHPFLAMNTNGVFASDSKTYTWENVRSDGTITACFGVTNYWLDAVNGDDANDGLSDGAALKSLYTMMTKAGRGDKVKVKPGVYDGCNYAIYGVEVESTDGWRSTIIDGGGTNRCLYGYDMVYRGFTIRNGRMTRGAGAGVYCGIFVDCVISNCTAAAGAGAAYATLTNCLVVGNYAQRYISGRYYYYGHGGGAYECDLFNCTLAGNRASYYGGGAYLHTDGGSAWNTIVCGNTSDAGSSYGNDVYGNGYWTMQNSLSDKSVQFRNAAQGDYHVKSLSPAVNRGNNAFVTIDHDLDGKTRIFRDTVDIGCYEYDGPPPGTLIHLQ